jgi:hypothetical protein
MIRAWSVIRHLSSVIAFSLPAAAAAQQPQGPPPCTAAEYRQFDFWVGDWIVEDSSGNQMGTNRIDRILDGCVLQENWNEGRPGAGKSFNIWSRITGKWHQTWVATGGNLVLLDGELVGDAMVLRGERQTPRGHVWDRITYRPLDGGRVQQLWEISTDSGRTWRASFDGRYRRRG